MSGLGEQIAVLDGLAALDPNDGRIGQKRASVAQYARPKIPGVLTRRDVLDPSEAANYSGGSSYAPGIPLGPSSWGLASLGNIPPVLPPKKNVVAPSGGVNYTGGSDWVPGLPLLVSSAGLAADIIRGGYGRAGLGANMIRGGYGRAGLGQTNSAVDEDLAGAAEAMETARALNPNDGRLGQRRVAVDEYGKPIMPGVLARSNVLDPSEAANYSGGSSYAPGIPLGPSSWGLAGLEAYDELDGLSDAALFGVWTRVLPKVKINAMKKAFGKAKLKNTFAKLRTALRRAQASRNPAKAQVARARAGALSRKMGAIRNARRVLRTQGATVTNFAMRAPLWAR